MKPEQAAPETRHGAFAFGRSWQSDLPLHAFEPAPWQAAADIRVALRTDPHPERTFTNAMHRVRHALDGSRYESEEFVADTYRSGRIDLWRGPSWNGALSPSFFGTVTSTLLTWSGGIAMHASAVATEGRAVLLCGRSGAGKSTLCAAMIAAGANMIADDLSVLWPQGYGRPATTFAGRRIMRLFPPTARMLSEFVPCETMDGQDESKVLLVPPRVGATGEIPLGGIVILQDRKDTARGARAAHALLEHVYRPRISQGIPGHALRRMQLQAIASQIPVTILPALPRLSPERFLAAGRTALDAVSKKFS